MNIENSRKDGRYHWVKSRRKLLVLLSTLTIVVVLLGATMLVPSSQLIAASASSVSATTQNQEKNNERLNTHFSFKGKSAEAYWYSEENEIYSEAMLFATDSAYKQKSDRNEESVMYLAIYQYKEGEEICEIYEDEEYCDVEYIPILAFEGYAILTPNAFALKGAGLSSATLNSEITGYDYVSDSEKTITIDADWSGTGSMTTGKNTYKVRSDDYRYSTHYTGSNRAADPIASLTGDINMVLDRPPMLEEYGYLYSAKEGYVEAINFN